MTDNPFADLPPMPEATLDTLSERIADLPEAHAEWVAQIVIECRRARGTGVPPLPDDDQAPDTLDANLAQVVLDAAEWLRTLWDVGYMGAATLPVPPRSHFPQIEVEDVMKSALFARIRHGKHPLPFPPPTRWGSPWHEVVESDEAQSVEAEIVTDEDGTAYAMIDGCNRWRVVRREDGGTCIVQHAGKGPLYRLTPDPFVSTLQRLPPERRCRIAAHERAGLRSFTLEWIPDNGRQVAVPLRAATREGAEAAANAWIARNHPGLYGHIAFEHA